MKPSQKRRIESAFTYHPPKTGTDQAARYALIRDYCKGLAIFLCESCPDSRELNSGLKSLEEVQAWAIAAIARNEV